MTLLLLIVTVIGLIGWILFFLVRHELVEVVTTQMYEGMQERLREEDEKK